uniref:histone deacetylase n=1 Tax=Polytomella parva TaxID=51329 RepID=A0A7S0ULI3_9CHLO
MILFKMDNTKEFHDEKPSCASDHSKQIPMDEKFIIKNIQSILEPSINNALIYNSGENISQSEFPDGLCNSEDIKRLLKLHVDVDSSSSSSSDYSSSYGSSISTLSEYCSPYINDVKGRNSTDLVAPLNFKCEDPRVGLLYDESMELHVGPDHYERPTRIIAVHDALLTAGLVDRCWSLSSWQATDPEILLAHTADHISSVDNMFQNKYPLRDPALSAATYCFASDKTKDVYCCAATATAARTAAGCCIKAARAVVRQEVDRAFAVVRPPGHHAECDRAMGFCFFNNVALAALNALQEPGIQRVAVLDWDVHHGNGIQEILYNRDDALYISIHRSPQNFYPYSSGFPKETGEGLGSGFNVNIPWIRKGMNDADYLTAMDLVVCPILDSFDPDLVIVAAGFDAAEGDPLGGCRVTPEGFAHMTHRLLRFAKGRIVLALEGGYNTRITAQCATSCVETLLGMPPPPLILDKDHFWPADVTGSSLNAVFEVQQSFWRSALFPCSSADPLDLKPESNFESIWANHLLRLQAEWVRLGAPLSQVRTLLPDMIGPLKGGGAKDVRQEEKGKEKGEKELKKALEENGKKDIDNDREISRLDNQGQTASSSVTANQRKVKTLQEAFAQRLSNRRLSSEITTAANEPMKKRGLNNIGDEGKKKG